MGQVVVAGRRELVRLQAVDPTAAGAQQSRGQEQAVSINRARRAAERLRRVAGQG
jgi:hypothetical protein